MAGYAAEELFWREVLDLVHEEDLPRVGSLLFEVIEAPGTSMSATARLHDASGNWVTVDFIVRNVLESPGDTGLVVADVRAARAPREGGACRGARLEDPATIPGAALPPVCRRALRSTLGASREAEAAYYPRDRGTGGEP